MERLREPDDFSEEGPPEPIPEAFSSGAGRRGPPTAIGSGFDESGFRGIPPGGYAGELERWWNAPIEDLDLPGKTYYTLRRRGYMTVGQILDSCPSDSLAINLFGPFPYADIREQLDQKGILRKNQRWPDPGRVAK